MTPIRILSLSDLHLGHHRLDPVFMCHGLRELIFPQIPTIDLMILAGDLFDTGIGISDRPTPEIFVFLCELLRLCHEYDVTVRILRGTYSHDRTQLHVVPALHTGNNFTNDVKVIDKLSLEHLKKFDLKIAYVPDDLPYPNTDAVLEDLHIQLADLHWDGVDYAVVHGYFQHVLPESAHAPKLLYRADQFAFVNRLVLIGHVHMSSAMTHTYETGHDVLFLYNGSPERSCHGEEEQKGIYRILDHRNKISAQFYPNTLSTLFVTMDLSNHYDTPLILQSVDQALLPYPKDRPMHLRIQHPDIGVRNAVQTHLKHQHPHVLLTYKKKKDQKDTDPKPMKTLLKDTVLEKAPTPDTLGEAVLRHLGLKNITHTLDLDRIEQYLS